MMAQLKKKNTLDKLSHVTWQLLAKANHMGTHPSLRARGEITFVTAKRLEIGTLPTQRPQQRHCSIQPLPESTFGVRSSVLQISMELECFNGPQPNSWELPGSSFPFLSSSPSLPLESWLLWCSSSLGHLPAYQLGLLSWTRGCLCLMIDPNSMTLDRDIQGFEMINSAIIFQLPKDSHQNGALTLQWDYTKISQGAGHLQILHFKSF